MTRPAPTPPTSQGAPRPADWPSLAVEAQPPDRERFVNPFNDRTLLAYYREIQAWHGYIRFLGLPHLRDNPDVPIDSLYVPPELSQQPIRPDQPLDKWAERTPALEALTRHPRVVVLGDPGSGKSTLVSWIAWHLSRGRSNPWAEALGPLLPLPMIVRELRLREPLGFDDLLEEFLGQPVAADLPRSVVEPFLERGQCLVLLDGLDEVAAEELRRGLRGAVREGVKRYPASRWLLTSRQVGYDRAPFHLGSAGGALDEALAAGIARGGKVRLRAGPEAAGEKGAIPEGARPAWAAVRYVAPFQDRQIETFTRNWYARFQESPAAAETKAQDLVSAIHASPRTLQLARVPNLLTLMALIHRIQARLPHGRALLYGKIVEAYLESIDAYRGLREVGYSLEEKRRWLAWVGFQMQRRRQAAIPEDRVEPGGREILVEEDELLAWLEEAMALSPRGGDVAEPRRAAHAFVEYIARRSGLLLPRGQGRYAFTHLSFQEFFAAFHLAERITSPRWFEKGKTEAGDGPYDLEAYSGQDHWREPLVLLFGLLAGRPEWSEELTKTLFGGDFFKLLDDQDSELGPLARLLAEVSTDPHSGFPGGLRHRSWNACWRWELRRQTNSGESGPRRSSIPVVLTTLLAVEEEDRNAVGEAFLAVVQDLKPPHLSLRGAAALQDLGMLAGLDNLELLNLSDTGVSDPTPLVRLAKLHWLDLSGTAVSDLTPLAGLKRLKELFLWRTRVSDLAPLAELKTLKWLLLWSTRVSDVTPLAELKQLEWLDLSETGVSDLTPLAGLSNLEDLDLSETGVSDIAPLAGLQALKELVLWNTGVSDVAPLARLGNLEKLDLSDTMVSDLAPLAGLSNLEVLDLAGTPVLDLAPLAGLERLRSLDLSRTGAFDMSPLAKLEDLMIVGSEQIVRLPQRDGLEAGP